MNCSYLSGRLQHAVRHGAAGPADLHGSGFSINPARTRSVTFATSGTYAITCSVHPNMNLTVIVQ